MTVGVAIRYHPLAFTNFRTLVVVDSELSLRTRAQVAVTADRFFAVRNPGCNLTFAAMLYLYHGPAHPGRDRQVVNRLHR